MKKVIALLLAAVMLSLCVLSVSAGVDVKATESVCLKTRIRFCPTVWFCPRLTTRPSPIP